MKIDEIRTLYNVIVQFCTQECDNANFDQTIKRICTLV